MKSTAWLSLALALGAVSGANGPTVARTTPRTVGAVEPLFGLPLTAAAIKGFDPAPAAVLSACSELENARWKRQLWVAATTATEDTTVYVLVGRFVATRPGDVAPRTDQGVVVRLRGTDCTLLGMAIEPFASPEAFDGVLPRQVLTALARDAAHRYRIAFGGAALRRSSKGPAAIRRALSDTPSRD